MTTVTGRASNESAGPALLKNIVCPHCWHRFEASEIVWVAKHEDLRGDVVLGQDAYMRFLPSRFNVAGEAIDARGMACQSHACPKCHLVVPRLFLKYRPLTFSLIGVPFSGKSYFLTAMIWELSRKLPDTFALAFSDVDPGGNFTLNEYQKTLFMQEKTDRPVGIIKTQLDSASHYDSTNFDGQSILLPRPFLYTLRPLDKHPKVDRLETLTRIVCLYDNAGEHFLPGQDTTVAPGTQHLARSEVLMFLFDPVQDTRIREQCRRISSDPQLSEYAHTQLQATILTEAVNRVRQYAHLPAHHRLDQPLIVLVSKSDVWGKLIDEDLVSDPYLDGDPISAVDIPRVRRVSDKVRDLLLELTPELVGTAEDCCKQVIYVPVSALGCSPVSQTGARLLVVNPKEIHPRWVTVPLMYAFASWSSGLVASRGSGS
jgi:hypothetical protein